MSILDFVKIAVIAFILSFIAFVATVHAHGHHEVPDAVCAEGLHVGNPHCVTPTVAPTVIPSVEPTIEVTPEVTVEPTATPSAQVEESHSGPDGLGCAVHDCSQHTIPAGAPATGRAL